VNIASITAPARMRYGRRRGHDAASITPMEARLLTLRPAGAAIAALPARNSATEHSPGSPTGRRLGGYASAAFWAIVLGTFAIGAYVIDTGGHATTLRPTTPASVISGSGRQPVTVAQGDVDVRVSVRAAGLWFWCLESSLGLAPAQHLCRNSDGTALGETSVVTSGAVRLDAASIRGATFYVQMYCPDICEWRAEVAPAAE
jgi:hypothetical protein